MAIKLNKKNPIAKNLFTKKFKPKIVKPKKGKGSFKRKKKIYFYKKLFCNINVKTYYYSILIRIILTYFMW